MIPTGIKVIEEQIERFFASDHTLEEKRQRANEMFKELAKLNRMVTEARGIGRESQLTRKPDNRMPEERLRSHPFFNRW